MLCFDVATLPPNKDFQKILEQGVKVSVHVPVNFLKQNSPSRSDQKDTKIVNLEFKSVGVHKTSKATPAGFFFQSVNVQLVTPCSIFWCLYERVIVFLLLFSCL